jgi:hypothetical protein
LIITLKFQFTTTCILHRRNRHPGLLSILSRRWTKWTYNEDIACQSTNNGAKTQSYLCTPVRCKENTASVIVKHETRCRWVFNFTPRPLYSQEKCPRYPFNWRLGGPQSQSGRFEKENNLFPLPRTKPRQSDCPARGLAIISTILSRLPNNGAS